LCDSDNDEELMLAMGSDSYEMVNPITMTSLVEAPVYRPSVNEAKRLETENATKGVKYAAGGPSFVRKAVDRGRAKFGVKKAIKDLRDNVILPEVLWDICIGYVL
jgi:hypothetical protein